MVFIGEGLADYHRVVSLQIAINIGRAAAR